VLFLSPFDLQTERQLPLPHAPHFPQPRSQAGCARAWSVCAPRDKAAASGSELSMRCLAAWPAFPQEMASRWDLARVNQTERMCVVVERETLNLRVVGSCPTLGDKFNVVVWPWLATKGHAVTLSPLPPLGWGGERKETGKNWWVGIRAV